MNRFELVRPRELEAAVSAAAMAGDVSPKLTARYLAGGTTLIDLMKLGVERPGRLVDVNRLGLDRIGWDPESGLHAGATARNADLAHHPDVVRQYPALSEALLAGASAQLRNVATTGGNLLQRTRCTYFRDPALPCNKRAPGTGCPAIDGVNRFMAVLGASGSCIATHPSDMAVAMLAYDAVVHLRGPDGQRVIPLAAFHLPPGDTPERENAMLPAELITHVTLPPAPTGARATYLKLRDRASYEFALASAAVELVARDGRIVSARFALGGVATVPWRVREAEALLEGRAADRTSFEAAADVALAGAEPVSQNGFKIELARRCLSQAFLQVAA